MMDNEERPRIDSLVLPASIQPGERETVRMKFQRLGYFCSDGIKWTDFERLPTSVITIV